MFRTLSVLFTQVSKPEWLEFVRIRIKRVVVVYASSSRGDGGAFRYERAVLECKVFQCLACQTH